MADLSGWFLTAHERGNPDSRLPLWCAGNRVEPLVHGATYFDRLVTEVESLRRGDYVFFIDSHRLSLGSEVSPPRPPELSPMS
jgi:hypothetical protein